MTRQRASLLSAVLAAVTVTGLAAVPGDASQPAAAVDTEPVATEEPISTSTTASPSTTTTTAPLPPLPAGGLRRGSEDPEVLALEQRLAGRHYDPGEVDGEFDGATAYAVMALEKVAGMAPTGAVGEEVWAVLAGIPDPAPMLAEGGEERVEIDLVRQLLFLYDGGALALVSHISSGSGVRYCAPGGCGVAVTPGGSHQFLWRVNGWQKSRLGRLYNPVYFTRGGVAIHGFPSVPTHPASHGCVRIPMHTAEWFPSRVEQGDPVYVFDGRGTPVTPLDPPDGGGGPLPPPPEGWLDGEPPPTPPTTEPPGVLV